MTIIITIMMQIIKKQVLKPITVEDESVRQDNNNNNNNDNANDDNNNERQPLKSSVVDELLSPDYCVPNKDFPKENEKDVENENNNNNNVQVVDSPSLSVDKNVDNQKTSKKECCIIL